MAVPDMNPDLNSSIHDIYRATLSERDFTRLSNFIMNEYGIKMPPVKKVMLESRLQKRLKSLNIANFKSYVDYLFTPEGQREEVIHMMDVVSTNKTEFFREKAHFDLLYENLLPEIYFQSKNKNLKLWSAGCSSGEEAYTLAIVLSEFAEKNPDFNFSILATDISTKMLKIAAEAIYKDDRVESISLYLKKKYFLKGKNREENKVRIIAALRGRIIFDRLNLIANNYCIKEKFDIIFCRNVLIYFDRQTQDYILNKLCSYLNHNGYLFLGHSESITGLKLPLFHIKPTVYQRT